MLIATYFNCGMKELIMGYGNKEVQQKVRILKVNKICIDFDGIKN